MKASSPEIVFEELFIDLHLSGLWEDGKMISDAIPLGEADIILKKYRETKSNKDFDLKQFFEENYKISKAHDSGFEADVTRSVQEHIEVLWNFLSRESLVPVKGSSSLPLPFPYIVPGGRFNEIYYWDSFFTMLGLKESGRNEMIENMLDNFAYMIDNIGFIPNGSRAYFLSRSQPPFFSLMVELLASINSDKVYLKYHESLIKEYHFWMKTSYEPKGDSDCSLRLVKIGTKLLNRYYDAKDTPRPEMYGADVHLAMNSKRDSSSLFRDLRSACESGWDFSSRWLNEAQELDSIHCSQIVPIDLNCLLYHLECTLSKSYKLQNNYKLSQSFHEKSENRKKAIKSLFWCEDEGFFMDFNFSTQKHCTVKSLAAIFPLYFGIADSYQAESVAQIIEGKFMKEGGLLTSCIESGQQWDAPNGWAPLQWMAIQALRNYSYDKLADDIKQRWTQLNIRVYKSTGKLLEKYNVVDMDLLSGGGEYPVQDGFGWTNGVLLSLLNEKEPN